MPSRTHVRLIFAFLFTLSTMVLATGFVASVTGSNNVRAGMEDGPHGIQHIPPNELTVATDHKSPSVGAKLVAFDSEGTVRYYNDTLDYYSDVDPSPTGKYTVTYVGTEDLRPKQCDGASACRRMVIERLNLSTDHTTRLYSRIVPTYKGYTLPYTNRWHDVDRINRTHFAVADIERDRVFVVNTSSGIVTWEWLALSHYSHKSGGPYPYDFTHVNDVEVLEDGRIMASIRNQDQVVFLNRTTGVVENWTIGEEGNHKWLFGQHNPDYIPESQGGPAVIIADSHNDRIVEYQRVNGSWEQSWVWRDNRLQWPRDADRLPNGNTLITDTHGNRVVEVDENGEPVWSVELHFPYDAERLGTGDESAGGESAQRADIAGREPISGANDDANSQENEGTRTKTQNGVSLLGLAGQAMDAIEEAIPEMVLNAVLYALPGWADVDDVFALAVLLGTTGAWGSMEAYWRGYRIRKPFSRIETDQQ
ncbi:arylsulfotransferase family protein [Haladaptatus caseinilyticus]|uniref:arylsulfotransferase family protein n=1 Tax=Haladaptatus caseinilyticus TaxID=2993314 RepID=UPI00224B2C3D|nr:arylsulfotransferase family protein [Haladaptatus caseinilyticus]